MWTVATILNGPCVSHSGCPITGEVLSRLPNTISGSHGTRVRMRYPTPDVVDDRQRLRRRSSSHASSARSPGTLRERPQKPSVGCRSVRRWGSACTPDTEVTEPPRGPSRQVPSGRPGQRRDLAPRLLTSVRFESSRCCVPGRHPRAVACQAVCWIFLGWCGLAVCQAVSLL